MTSQNPSSFHRLFQRGARLSAHNAVGCEAFLFLEPQHSGLGQHAEVSVNDEFLPGSLVEIPLQPFHTVATCAVADSRFRLGIVVIIASGKGECLPLGIQKNAEQN